MCVKLLLEYQACPNILDHDGFGPLHVACECGATDLVRLLLDFGAKPNEVQKERNSVRHEIKQYWSPIHIAAKNNFPDILRILLEKCPEPDIKNNSGITSLHIAAGQKDIECLEILLEYGADIENVDMEGDPPLFVAVQSRLLKHAQKLANNQTTIIADIRGETALHLAAKFGFPELVSFLIEQNSNILACDMFGNTPLHNSVLNKHKECVRILLENGADPVQRNDQHQSPFALSSGEIAAMMKTFLEKYKEKLRAQPVDKTPRSTKTSPSRLRSQLSPSQMANRENAPSSLAAKNSTPNSGRQSSSSSASLKKKKKQQQLSSSTGGKTSTVKAVPATCTEFQKQIEDSICAVAIDIRKQINEVKKMVELLKEDLSNQ